MSKFKDDGSRVVFEGTLEEFDYELGAPKTESTLFRFKKRTDESIKRKTSDLKIVKKGRKVIDVNGNKETTFTISNAINKLKFYKTYLENIKIV